MKNMYIAFLLIVTFFFVSCDKRDAARQTYAGPKKITRHELLKIDTLTQKFTNVIYDKNDLGEVILWDNASDTYNKAEFNISDIPFGFFKNGVSPQLGVGWYVDAVEERSMTFFSEPNAGNVMFCTYNMEKNISGKITLYAVLGSGSELYKEIIELTPMQVK